MKEVVLRIEESAFDKYMEFFPLCTGMEVVKAYDCMETKETIDQCFLMAILTMRENNAFRTPGDYGYIMQAINDEVIKELHGFGSPYKYIMYMVQLGLEGLPGKTTIYDTLCKIDGVYPNWTFFDAPTPFEALRRKNIVKQFLSAFSKARRMLSDDFSDKL